MYSLNSRAKHDEYYKKVETPLSLYIANNKCEFRELVFKEKK